MLAARHANIRAREQRCLVLDQKIAFQKFQISALNSEIESLDEKYRTDSQHLRVLLSEVEEFEELEKERDSYYDMKRCEMKEFRENVEKFVDERRMIVEQLRNGVKELQSCILKLPGNNGNISNYEIGAAEMRKSELTALKENLDRNLASNYEIRAQLQKHLENMLD